MICLILKFLVKYNYNFTAHIHSIVFFYIILKRLWKCHNFDKMSFDRIHLFSKPNFAKIPLPQNSNFQNETVLFFRTSFRCCAMLSCWSTNNCNMKNSKILWMFQSSARMFPLQHDIQNKAYSKYQQSLLTPQETYFIFFLFFVYNVICRKSPCNPSNATMCRD